MITIIGNGESRKTINVDNIKDIKVGCNGIYLYHSVDLLCAMDKFWREKIVKESKIPLLSRHINNAYQPTLEIYNGKWNNVRCPYRGYCSGTTALDYICSQYKDDIYLIGFDFDYNGEFVNHIYKNTPNHPKENRPAQNENIFVNETIEIIRRYPKHNIFWVTNSDYSNTIYEKYRVKIKTITIEEYKKLAYSF